MAALLTVSARGPALDVITLDVIVCYERLLHQILTSKVDPRIEEYNIYYGRIPI